MVKDPNTSVNFMVDTGSAVSLLPCSRSAGDKRLKAGSHRSRQRYRSVAVTSNVKVFTQKILAVTEVIFLISSVLR